MTTFNIDYTKTPSIAVDTVHACSFTQSDMIVAGQLKAAMNATRTAASVIAAREFDVEELCNSDIVAIMSSVIYGAWDAKVVCLALTAAGYDTRYNAVCLSLRTKGILTNGTVFTDKFTNALDALMDELIAAAPARMMPSTEMPADWDETEFNHELQMSLVKGASKSSETVRLAVNKAQRVAYTVNSELGQYFNMVDMSDMTQSQRNQIRAQMVMYRELVGKTVYFTYTLDYRSRMYARGGILTPQGSDFCKAMFKFANPVALGDSGYKGLCIHYANLCGQDKLPMIDRIMWAETHGIEFGRKLFTGEIVMGRKEKFQAIMAGEEFKRIRIANVLGMPYAEIESDLVCHQDGTCNGLQHGAAITGHRATAEAVNCTASTWTDAVSDVYRLASEVMLAELEKHDLPMVTAAVRGNGRNLLKLPIMVTGYGAGIVTACADFNTGLYGRALPESIANRQIIQDCMTVALETHAGAMITLTAAFNEATKNLWQDAITWTTQDGFHAVQYNSAKKERIVTDKNGKEELKAERTYAGAGSHTIRTDKNEANESAQICAVSPNFIHSIDATHLRAVIRKCNWDLVTVHDSIGSHAAHYFATNKHVRDTFASVHTYEWLANFNLNQGSDISVNMGDYSAQEAVQSTYLFS